MSRSATGTLFDVYIGLVFIVLVISKTALLNRVLRLEEPSYIFWLSSAAGFIASLLSLLGILLIAPGIIVGTAMNFGSLSANVFVSILILLLAYVNYLTERLILIRSGMNQPSSKKLSLYSSVSLTVLVIGLMCAMYLVAMEYF